MRLRLSIVGLLLGLSLGLTSPRVAPAETSSVSFPTLEELERDLQSGPEYRRILAVQGIARYGQRSDVVPILLHAMLYDRSQAVQRAAQRRLTGVQDPRIYPAIVAALADPKDQVQLAALDALILVRDASAANYFLESADAHARNTVWVRTVLESLREFVIRMEPPEGFELKLHPWLQHRDRKIQMTTVAILGILSRPASLQPLISLWAKANTAVKIRLADALANLARLEAAPLMLEALDEKSKPLQMHALYALAQIQTTQALDKIRDLMQKQSDSRIRMACLYALIEIPDPESIPAILKIFDQEDAAVLHWAAYALGQLQAQSALPQLLEKLGHTSSLVRASAAMALGELHALDSQDRLLLKIQDPKETDEVKMACAKALMALNSRQGAPVFWDLLQREDVDTETRLNFGLALGAIGGEAYRDQLRGHLEDSKYTMQFSSALALSRMRDNRAKPVLLPALEHGYPLIRRYAILGLESIMDAEAQRALADTANDDPDVVVRILCAQALVQAGYPEYRVALWSALDNKSEDIRSEAIIALGRGADADICKQLKWYLRREPSIPVRQTIHRVLKEYSAAKKD